MEVVGMFVEVVDESDFAPREAGRLGRVLEDLNQMHAVQWWDDVLCDWGYVEVVPSEKMCGWKFYGHCPMAVDAQ